MKALTELSTFIESESFNILDEETRKNVVLKLRETIDDICNQYGISNNNMEEDSSTNSYFPRIPDLYLGLTPIEVDNMPKDYVIHWVLGTDNQGVACVICSNGKYGLFRASFMGMGMGVDKFYSIKNPFRFDDVRICVPSPGFEYYGYLATLEKKEWAVWIIDIYNHPLKMVDGCKSFDEAKREMEAIIGEPSPYPWVTFDDFDECGFASTETPNAHNPNAELIVTFPDGTVFDDDKAISTFVKTIQKIGFDKVAKVGIMIKGYNLVDTRQRTDKGRTWQKQVGKYFVYSYLSNGEKLKCLNQIDNYYNLGLKIETK
jgi:hypothetical protein